MSDSSVRPCPIVFDWCYVSASYCAESVLIFHPRAQSQIRGGAFRAHSPPQAKNERNGTSMPCGGRRNRAVPPLEIVGNKSTNTTEKQFTHNNRIMAYQVPEIGCHVDRGFVGGGAHLGVLSIVDNAKVVCYF